MLGGNASSDITLRDISGEEVRRIGMGAADSPKVLRFSIDINSGVPGSLGDGFVWWGREGVRTLVAGWQVQIRLVLS